VVDILLSLCEKVTAKSLGERILKIGQQWTKLEEKYCGTYFPDRVYTLAFSSSCRITSAPALDFAFCKQHKWAKRT